MVQRVQKYLSHGYTLQTWLDDDFLYTYYFWVNIPSSNTLGVSTFLCACIPQVGNIEHCEIKTSFKLNHMVCVFQFKLLVLEAVM